MPRQNLRASTLKADLSALEKVRSPFSTRDSLMLSSASEDSTDPSNVIDRKISKGKTKRSMYHRSLLGIPSTLSEMIDEGDEVSWNVEEKKEEVERKAFAANSPFMARAETIEEITDEDEEVDDLDPVFESVYTPSQMRCLALVAHNHMKPAMKQFVLANKNLLKKFKLTGTNTTMTMLREVFGDDPSVEYGPTCTSGPLGGDAELVAVMCTENLGGCVFFQDPMSAHPHTADIECLCRQANVHNVLMMPNPATAFAIMTTFRIALKEGKADLIPSFFQTLESPSVAEYKVRQSKVVEDNKN